MKCWSFCGDSCELKKHGLCLPDVPAYRCPPPNDGAQSVSDLKFGISDYEHEIMAYNKKKLKDKSTPHWRELLRGTDPYALIYIYEDPEIKDRFCHTPLWNPSLFQEMILNSVEILASVLSVARHGFISSPTDRRIFAVTRKIKLFYRQEFEPANIEYLKSVAECITSGKKEEAEYCISRSGFAKDLFHDQGAIIVARWLLEMSCTAPEFWINKAKKISENLVDEEIPGQISTTGKTFVFKGVTTGQSEIKEMKQNTGIRFKK